MINRILLTAFSLIIFPAVLMAMGNKSNSKPIAFEVIESGTQGGTSEEMNLIAKTEADFKYIWDLTHRSIEPKLPQPPVDFSKEIVACVMMGERTSSGYKVEARSIIEKKDSIIIDIFYNESGGMLTVMTYPYQIIKFPKTIKKIVFNKITVK